MKILPIGNQYNSINYIHNNQLKNSQSNSFANITDLNLLNKNYNQISFNGVSKETMDIIQKIPISERIASVYQHCSEGDLVLVGKSLSKAKMGLLQTLSQIDRTIKKVFFIPDEKIHGYLGFMRDEDSNQILNLNDFNIKVVNETGDKIGIGLNIKNVAGYDSYYVADGSSIWVNDKTEIPFKTKPESNLIENWMKNFVSVKDSTNTVNSEIEKINRKTVSQLSKEAKADQSKVTFKDVGGQDKLINELKKSVIYPLKYPEAYSSFDINRGFILYGPPGTGKTHIARALANEADVNFVSLNGVELESKWVGESEENWRNLFDEAKQKQPTIMFIDEFDAIAKSRGGQDVYGDKVVNQILTLMTDLDNNAENVFVIGATNNFKALDGAIVRSGRFSKHLEVKMPDLEGTRKIFDIHTAKKHLDRNLDKETLTKRLYDLKTSGADIKYIVNEAHSKGYERAGIYEKMENGTLTGKDLRGFWITQEDFDNAIKSFIETRHGTERQTIGFNK